MAEKRRFPECCTPAAGELRCHGHGPGRRSAIDRPGKLLIETSKKLYYPRRDISTNTNMPAVASVPKELYLCTSLKDLNKKTEIKPEKTSTKSYVQSALKIFKAAEESRLDRDEEKAYILYMKYVTVYNFIKKRPDFKQQQDYFHSILGPTNLKKAIEEAERLSESLKLRYEEAEVRKKLEERDRQELQKKQEPKDDGKGTAKNSAESAVDSKGKSQRINGERKNSPERKDQSDSLSVDFTYPSLEEPAAVPPAAVTPAPTEATENEETGDNLEERLKSLNRSNIQDAAVAKSDSSFVVNPVSITRSIPEVDRSKKPSLKIPDDNRPRAQGPGSDSQPVENGRVVPDRSTKPVRDMKGVLSEEEKSQVHAETAALLEKNRREKELRERQQQEQKERLKREKEEQEQKEKEQQEQKAKEQKEKEHKERLQQSKEDREQKDWDDQIKREQEEKEQERARRETIEAKKQNKNEPENIGAKRIEIDKISMEEREKGTRTPEMQRRALGDASPTFVTVSGKVSEKENHHQMWSSYALKAS
ncbi:hypothetical protein WISP_114701 [Willisornis vidua]|uniref:USP8 dimerisation domain-containing protein n=1 Tax=Willisornis vidua TaxID=1566151 RepID=A0ABQ9CVD9_9PASS|nr:hypothetical protein WISP_114701 [Willisornis vidua]